MHLVLRSRQVGRQALVPGDPEQALNVAAERREFDAADSLAHELPYWGWLEDGRTCLTRSGELVTAAPLRPAVVDRVLGRQQWLLSGCGPDTRLHFHMLRRPCALEGEAGGGSGIAAVSQRKRQTFLTGRVQELEAYVVWSHDPRLRTVVDGSASGRASRLTAWWTRRGGNAPAYLDSEIEAAACRFQILADADRALVSEHTPLDVLPAAEASRFLAELINRPGTV